MYAFGGFVGCGRPGEGERVTEVDVVPGIAQGRVG